MLLELGNVVTGLEVYMHTCSCHPDRFRKRNPDTAWESFTELGRYSKPCACMGMLSPDMAAGAWKE
eukprot:12586941-Alexandrium_andersonii.AAC.1